MKNFDQIIEHIKTNKSFVLSTHYLPDGDGLGSEYALYFLLKKLGKDVKVINDNLPPRHLKFLDPDSLIFESYESKLDYQSDVLIGLDIFDIDRIEFFQQKNQLKFKHICFVDHHHIKEKFDDNFIRWVDPSKSSVGSMVYEIIEYFEVPFTHDMAKGVYLSLIADTGNFGAGTTVGSHEVAIACLNAGIEPGKFRDLMKQNESLESLKFLSKVLGLIQSDACYAFVHIPLSLQEQFEVDSEDFSKVIHYVSNIKDIEFSWVLREDHLHKIRVQLRCRSDLNLLQVARQFGGGGHSKTVGWVMEGSLQDCHHIILQVLQEKFNQKF